MYEWKALRILAGLLLCLPVVHLTYVVSEDLNRYLDPSPEVWEAEMRDLIRDDMEASIPSDPLLVVGGHRVRLWRDLPARLQPRPTLLRPLGDATLEDISHHYQRLVGFYRPAILVVFPGYADLHLRDEKSPEEFEKALTGLLKLDESYGSTSWRYVIAPVHMPLHPEDQGRISEIARRTEALAARLGNTTIIDPNPTLRGLDGEPNPAFFSIDGINLSAEGYARISMLLEEHLRQQPVLLAQTPVL